MEHAEDLIKKYYSGVKLFKKLFLELRHTVEHPKKLNSNIKNYLLTHCIYNLDEFFY
jgi:hypothetical protein